MKKTLVLVIGCICVAGLLAADPWDKPWTEWKDKDARRVLQKSPWVVDHYVNDTTVARMTWRSALPVRLAQARLVQLGNPEATEEQVQQYINQPVLQQYIAIGLEFWQDRDRAAPQKIIQGQEAGFEIVDRLIRDLMRLHTSNMLSEYVYFQKKDNERIHLIQYVPPKEGSPQAMLFFPRFDDSKEPIFSLDDKEVVLMLELSQIGQRIRRKFDFKKMQYDGKLEL